MNKLSVLLITFNAEELLDKSLCSIYDIANEIIVVDTNSTDNTRKIARKYNSIIINTFKSNLGEKRMIALKKAKNEWILVLDADEIVTPQLKNEIRNILKQDDIKFDGYFIPYQNHFLNREIRYGGENYKVLRLFKKNKVKIHNSLIHEKYDVIGRTMTLNSSILHYSYRSIYQMYSKFTKYALIAANEKYNNGEHTSLKKIFLYPIHMFWARFVEDKGYKDGMFRMPLDIGFAYMEFLTYTRILFLKRKK